MSWQPIETAPKDGTEVLLWFAQFETRRIGAWMPWGDSSYPFLWQDCHGGNLHRPWKYEDENYDYPTHWHPLPEPPK